MSHVLFKRANRWKSQGCAVIAGLRAIRLLAVALAVPMLTSAVAMDRLHAAEAAAGANAAEQSVDSAARPTMVDGQPHETAEEIDRLVQDLDSQRFDVRQRASVRLKALCQDPEAARIVAREFERLLVSPDISFEVRSQLKRLKRGLPEVEQQPVGRVGLEEIRQLIGQLEDVSFSTRLGARRRLEWLLSDAKLAWPIMFELKRRLAAVDHSADARQWLEPVYERARGAWLLGDDSYWDLPDVPSERIVELVDRLAEAPPAKVEGTWHVHRTTHRELSDLLAREDTAARVVEVLERRLEQDDLGKEAATRLRRLVDLARPAMVAEYWQGRRNLGEQHLLIGVPSLSEGARRPSHFDQINDEVAHCVSGNSLSPGDYPVGVAFPHPLQPGAFFHLVNLPTPRRRMAYSYHTKTDETARLRAISRRTLNRFLELKRPLSEAELVMLAHLDPTEFSRFAGKFLLAVDDEPLPAQGTNYVGGRCSRHGTICALLALEGTREAEPGLLEAIENERFLPPTAQAPYRMHYLAALSIASRDPWPEVDKWLAGQLSARQRLVERDEEVPELAATAAAILLKRHNRSLAEFGLWATPDDVFEEFELDGFRFDAAESRDRLLQWWRTEGEQRGANDST